MPTPKDHLRSIDASASAAARSQAEQAKALKGLQFTSAATLGASMVTAAQQNRNQQELIAIQREQQALQQEASARTAIHEFSMWRQTPDGKAFLQWSDEAISLIAILRQRDRIWQQAWAQAIDRARAAVPADEQKRFHGHAARLRQSGLKIAAIVCSALVGIAIIGLLLTNLMTSVSRPAQDQAQQAYDQCVSNIDGMLLTQANCDAIKPPDSANWPAIWLVIFLVLAVVFLVMRKVKQRAAKADPAVASQARARTERWGFDPLTTQAAWYPWYSSPGFAGYVDRLQHQLETGPSLRPEPGHLLTIIVPEPLHPTPSLPPEVNQALELFQQHNTALSN